MAKRIFTFLRREEPLESAIRNCIDTNAVMQLTLESNTWCGNWGDTNKCPYFDKGRENNGVKIFYGCNYERNNP